MFLEEYQAAIAEALMKNAMYFLALWPVGAFTLDRFAKTYRGLALSSLKCIALSAPPIAALCIGVTLISKVPPTNAHMIPLGAIALIVVTIPSAIFHYSLTTDQGKRISFLEGVFCTFIVIGGTALVGMIFAILAFYYACANAFSHI